MGKNIFTHRGGEGQTILHSGGGQTIYTPWRGQTFSVSGGDVDGKGEDVSEAKNYGARILRGPR